MLVRLHCPACGKSLLIDVYAATERVVCRACGASFEPPPDCALPDPSTLMARAASGAEPRRGGGRVVPVAIAATFVLLMIGALVAVALRRRPATMTTAVRTNLTPVSSPIPAVRQAAATSAENDQALSDRVLAIKSDADVLALSGNFQAAADKYRQIEALLSSYGGSDPLLRELLRQATEGEKRANALLAAARPLQPRPVTAPPSAVTPASGQPIPAATSDFGPDPSAAATGSQGAAPGAPATVAPAAPSAGQSDFGDPSAPSSPQSQGATTAPSINSWRGIGDAQIGHAIDRGVGFLLAQVKDGELPPDGALADSQRQALDALCAYALAQSWLATGDPRLNPHGTAIPQLLDKLRGFDLRSDGQTTNRPITYGRSLRAAALATLNRPDDREVLKQDVAWLIKSQIGGAYTYDDLYLQMMQQGMKPAPEGAPSDTGVVTPANQKTCGDFDGGSPAPGFTPGGGPYTGGGSTGGYPPSPQIPVGRSPIGGVPPGPPPIKTQGRTGPVGPPPPIFQYVPSPWSRSYMGSHMPHPTPQKPIGGPIGPTGPSLPPALNDGFKVPLPTPSFVFPWDNSNSQYGLLGVWAGAEVGMEVPDAYWNAVEHHWIACQLGTGEWAYHERDRSGYYAMTCAGVASLLVTHDYLDIPQLKGTIGRDPYSPSLAAGLAWLDKGDNSVTIPNAGTHYVGYDLFGIERVGLASGFKYFGAHDWYRELAGKIVPLQFANGAFGHEDHGHDAIIDTAYTLLFLARGRHPVMMTKLKFGGHWDNRPRDLANLAKFAGRELERPLNWQVVGIEHDWQDYFDSPVLYIASHEAPKFKDADYLKLRSFVLAGGLIFTQADGSSSAFNAWVPELAKRIAPDYKLEPLPENSPIYSIEYKLTSHPPMLGVSNGARLLLVHSPVDLSLAWQERSSKTKRYTFELGTNVFVYASGKPDLRNRLDSPFIPPPPTAPPKVMRVAVLKYTGNWNPEPAAWFRTSRAVQWDGGPALDIRPIAIADLSPGICPLATLTGTDAHEFTAAETAALRAYVDQGGTLLIDAVGGDNAFTHSVQDALLKTTFADGTAEMLKPDHPLLQGLKPGLANDSPLRLRSYAIDHLGRLAPPIQVLRVGKGHVLFSVLDLTSGLLGTKTWGILGFEPVSSQQFAKNLIRWAQPS